MNRRFKTRMVWGLWLLSSAVAGAATVPPWQIETRAREWMESHPVMGTAATRAIQSITVFPEEATPFVYVVELSPRGYLVLNSDDRLTPILAFDAQSTVDLSDTQGNAFRAMLVRYTSGLQEKLDALPVATTAAALRWEATDVTQTHGPYLTTSWNQNHPYNLYAPAVPSGGSSSYGYRTPAGCTPTAYSQIMYYHRWPYRALGTYHFADTLGSITGTHTAVFSGSFNWTAMQNSYTSWATTEQPGVIDVASLIYRMAVVAQPNFERDGTPVSMTTPAAVAADTLFYEQGTYISDLPILLETMNANLIAGFPCPIGIPNHAIVADGLITGSGSDIYHINYGWGGSNNGWWTADNVAGDTISYGVTGVRPRLVVFSEEQEVATVAGEPTALHWILPQRRETEAAQINIKHAVAYTGTWSHAAEDFGDIDSINWSLEAGNDGSAWFSNTAGAALTPVVEFTPGAASMLSFLFKHRVATRAFYVQVSTNQGDTWDTLFTASNNVTLAWEQKNLPP